MFPERNPTNHHVQSVFKNNAAFLERFNNFALPLIIKVSEVTESDSKCMVGDFTVSLNAERLLRWDSLAKRAHMEGIMITDVVHAEKSEGGHQRVHVIFNSAGNMSIRTTIRKPYLWPSEYAFKGPLNMAVIKRAFSMAMQSLYEAEANMDPDLNAALILNHDIPAQLVLSENACVIESAREAMGSDFKATARASLMSEYEIEYDDVVIELDTAEQGEAQLHNNQEHYPTPKPLLGVDVPSLIMGAHAWVIDYSPLLNECDINDDAEHPEDTAITFRWEDEGCLHEVSFSQADLQSASVNQEGNIIVQKLNEVTFEIKLYHLDRVSLT